MVGGVYPVVKGFIRRKPTNMMTSVDECRHGGKRRDTLKGMREGGDRSDRIDGYTTTAGARAGAGAGRSGE